MLVGLNLSGSGEVASKFSGKVLQFLAAFACIWANLLRHLGKIIADSGKLRQVLGQIRTCQNLRGNTSNNISKTHQLVLRCISPITQPYG